MDDATYMTRPPRVCMLLESFYPVVGGMETQARNMAASFAERGVELLFVTRRTSPDLPARESVDGFPVYRVPPGGKPSRGRWLMILTCIPTLVRLRRRYDVILVPGFRTLGVAAVIVGKLFGKASVLKAESCGEMSGDFFLGGLEQRGLKKSGWPIRLLLGIRNRILVRADALISLSRDMTDEFARAGVPAARHHVIPQSADAKRFRPAADDEEKRALRRALSLPEEHRIVIFTGRIVSYKGVPKLVAVWEKLCAEFSDITLSVVGAGGVDLFNCEEEIRAAIARPGLAGRVVMPGAVRNVEEYLRAADIYAFPTENEAFPLALLEAMASGLPAVATTVGGIPDVIEPEVNGLSIAPGDVAALEAALRRLLGDPALRRRLGQAAVETVRDRYTRESVTERYLSLFRCCLDAK